MNSRSFIPVLIALFYLTAFATANADTPLEMIDAERNISSTVVYQLDDLRAYSIARLRTPGSARRVYVAYFAFVTSPKWLSWKIFKKLKDAD